MSIAKTADDFMRRLDAIAQMNQPTERAEAVNSLKTDLHEKIFAPKHDYTYIDRLCKTKDIDLLREELIFDDMFLDSACALIQEVYEKSMQKGQVAISDRIERVVGNEPWGWPIDRIKWVDWTAMSSEQKAKEGNKSV